VRALAGGRAVSNVPLLLDTGADVSLLPRGPIMELLADVQVGAEYEVEAFDGTKSWAPVVQAEIMFLGKSFRGQFLLIDSPYGYLGRNILNNVAILLDGPSLIWNERQQF
jgi:hypothetical protein